MRAPSSTRPRRSLLYVPASNMRAIEKVRALPCDAIILDLEDSVAPEAKDAARDVAVAVVANGGLGDTELIVRTNGLDTTWGRADLAALAAAGPSAILVPKVSDGAEVTEYDRLIATAPPHTRLWAMIETARSMFRLDEIAAQSGRTRLSGWVMGTNDLAKEMRAELDGARQPFLAMMAMSVAAARAWNITIIDGVFNALDDEDGFARQCRQARAFGFDGKSLIHPRQIEPCNRVFTPSDADVAAARAVVAAFAEPGNQGRGVLNVGGRMVERLHLAQAEALLGLSDSIAAA